MSKIKTAFDHGKAFIAFLTCGDPDLETTAAAVRAAAANGADLIELGIPFSDPTAEGPVIQGANLRALKAGFTTDKIFHLVEELRKDVTIPLVFMTYANVVFSYGIDRFLERAAQTGVDGLILPDVPYEEKEEFAAPCRAHGLDLISLIAPTSQQRTAAIAREAEGFLCLTAQMDEAQPQADLISGLGAIVHGVRENTQVPCVVDCALAAPEQAGQMAGIADGVTVGSALVKLLKQYGAQAPEHIGAYVKSMKEALSGSDSSVAPGDREW